MQTVNLIMAFLGWFVLVGFILNLITAIVVKDQIEEASDNIAGAMLILLAVMVPFVLFYAAIYVEVKKWKKN